MTVESTAPRKPRRSAGSKAKGADPDLVQLLTPEGKRVKNAKTAPYDKYVA